MILKIIQGGFWKQNFGFSTSDLQMCRRDQMFPVLDLCFVFIQKHQEEPSQN